EVHLWIDRDVLGRTPGMELRRWFEQATIPLRLHVHRTNFRGTVLPPAADDVFLFGDQAARMTAFGTRHRMWLVHPSVPPPRHSGEISETILGLPEIDETGLAEAWRKWASRVGARVVVARHVGQDI